MWRVTLIAAALPLLQACDEVPRRIGIGPHPAEPSAAAPGANYKSVTGDARKYRIVEPRPWGQINQDVAPKSK